MPTSSTDGTGQEPPTPQSPDGNGQEPPTSQEPRDSRTGNSITTLEDALAALEAARKDGAQRRVDAKRLAELEAAEQQRADAALSDKERHEKQKAEWQKERDALLLKIQEKATSPRIEREAEKLGISPKLALAIMPRDKIDYDENGDPTNIPELLKATIEALEIAVPAVPSPSAQQRQPAVVPQTGATNPPRGTQLVGPNGRVYDRNEIPKLSDPGLWKRG